MTPAASACRCPHGHAALTVRDREGHVGHGCASCRGAWLPLSYLRTIAHGRRFSAEQFITLLAAQPATATALACPQGCGPLSCREIKGIALDWCAVCQGVWFDAGEIARLLAHYPARRAPRAGSDEGLDAGDVFDIADVALSLFDLFS